MTLYALRDYGDRKGGAFPVAPEAAHRFNRAGYGIFAAVNLFRGRRLIANLVRVRAWAVEIDGSKEKAAERINSAPLVPSRVVETRHGYHLYWDAKDGTPENHHAIVTDRLVPFFGADPNARDLARILRVPGFLHMKNPAEPFLVREVHRLDVGYREAEMLRAFPDIGGAERARREAARKRAAEERARGLEAGEPIGDDFWERAFNLDCEYALTKLSGHAAVNREEFAFRRVAGGNLNIIVNGESTACFIDQRGRIGSGSKGGPGIAQWLRWYGGRSYKDVRRILLEVFPELERKQAR